MKKIDCKRQLKHLYGPSAGRLVKKEFASVIKHINSDVAAILVIALPGCLHILLSSPNDSIGDPWCRIWIPDYTLGNDNLFHCAA
jgi:hypothetical protein